MKKIKNDEIDNRKISKEVEEILELNEIYYSISKIIIEYRKEHKITQGKLAKMLNVNQTMISKIESGKYNPSIKQIYKISRGLTGNTEMFENILKEILSNLENTKRLISN